MNLFWRDITFNFLLDFDGSIGCDENSLRWRKTKRVDQWNTFIDFQPTQPFLPALEDNSEFMINTFDWSTRVKWQDAGKIDSSKINGSENWPTVNRRFQEWWKNTPKPPLTWFSMLLVANLHLVQQKSLGQWFLFNQDDCFWANPQAKKRSSHQFAQSRPSGGQGFSLKTF